MEKRIVKKEFIDSEEFSQLKALENICCEADKIVLKLELEYKLSVANNDTKSREESNDYLYYIDGQLVAYIGLCSFGGQEVEISGMVHPDFRKQGLFTELFDLLKEEIIRRKPFDVLLLCDRQSTSGTGFILKNKGVYKFSEYEMILDQSEYLEKNMHRGLLKLRKASNKDADEIRRQNAIYFGTDIESVDMVLPEEEAKNNFYIYMAEVDGKIIGKTNINYSDGVAGIYGLGIIPDYRGKGFGRDLLNMSVEKSLEMKATEVMLQVEVENKNALNLYNSVGFKTTSTMDYYSFMA